MFKWKFGVCIWFNPSDLDQRTLQSDFRVEADAEEKIIIFCLLLGCLFIGWYSIREAECPLCSCCFRYSAHQHVSLFSLMVIADMYSLLFICSISNSALHLYLAFSVRVNFRNFYLGGAMILAVSKPQISLS